MTITHNVASDMSELVDPDEKIEWLGSGYGGHDDNGTFLGVAEGPVWIPESNHLVFTDNGRGVRYRWSESEGVVVLDTDTNQANGQTRDPQGRLIWCEHAGRRVCRRESDGSTTVVAGSYRGLRLNRPNDVVTDADGGIWFTDPFTFGVQSEVDLAGVYRVAPDLSSINLVLRDFAMPNGLVFSLDETVLFVNDTARMHIRAFEIDRWAAAGGRPDLATDRVVVTMRGDAPGAPDGMKVDAAGRLWCTGPGGIWVIDPESGSHLGTVLVPGHSVTNFTFGGADLKTLFFTTYTDFGRVRLRVPGVTVPRSVRRSS
ncbi:SMP-30/gluconolactonase/LRE family protein [Amycolatopsis pithecellobii]|uniref:SMP-30/gluconolactonase/LRE family protein n=1 Tax=Amycolatopsis pithecellobii TaxID=664692 RepID=A0A6N7YW37_9PSEU|nr:SMP-30/gluconolactonase/LRE family protein [Amycolatopsis pithecellobii]MTD52549.1 SMP-30/gluconolactonase/LRE family protein [Amycolatopsis pithecellobii]